MPLEGHYRKVNTPLRKLTKRERNVVIGVGLVTLVAVLALLFLPSHNDKPLLESNGGQRAGCVETAVAGRVGSEPVVGCGTKAEQICRRASNYDDPRARTILEACRVEGVEF